MYISVKNYYVFCPEVGERESRLLNPPQGSTDPERFATVSELAACKALGIWSLGALQIAVSETALLYILRQRCTNSL